TSHERGPLLGPIGLGQPRRSALRVRKRRLPLGRGRERVVPRLARPARRTRVPLPRLRTGRDDRAARRRCAGREDALVAVAAAGGTGDAVLLTARRAAADEAVVLLQRHRVLGGAAEYELKLRRGAERPGAGDDARDRHRAL